MNWKIYTLIASVAVIISWSCQPVQNVISTKGSPDTLLVTINGLNISEDLSGNDELVILGYSYSDSVLSKPLFAQQFLFYPNTGSKQFLVVPWMAIANKPLVIFLLEEDADTSITQLDATIRTHQLAIRKIFAARNYTALEKYLGDDDVLGIKKTTITDCSAPALLNFSGIYKLDKYEYVVSIACKKY